MKIKDVKVKGKLRRLELSREKFSGWMSSKKCTTDMDALRQFQSATVLKISPTPARTAADSVALSYKHAEMLRAQSNTSNKAASKQPFLSKRIKAPTTIGNAFDRRHSQSQSLLNFSCEIKSFDDNEA